MLDTPKRNQDQDAVGELDFLMMPIEQEAVPTALTTLAEELGDALVMRTTVSVEPA
ncbi:MAG: hypothetical protein ACT6QU_18760 [Aliihoeflea sp.]|uniref:hypothetical protein n=1 Tax=Aliihoeflea sp. TaxID=2608088 RepID=UPI0040338245